METALQSRLEALLVRDEVERFLYREAQLLDAWELETWLTLFAADCAYIIGPTGEDPNAELSSERDYFIASDDRFRLEQRALRLLKTSAHAEYPHSRTRHLYANILVEKDDGARLNVAANFVTFRARNGENTYYAGKLRYLLDRHGDSFRITEKFIALDHDSLAMQGKLSIIL